MTNKINIKKNDYIYRDLEVEDYEKGFLDLLS